MAEDKIKKPWVPKVTNAHWPVPLWACMGLLVGFMLVVILLLTVGAEGAKAERLRQNVQDLQSMLEDRKEEIGILKLTLQDRVDEREACHRALSNVLDPTR